MRSLPEAAGQPLLRRVDGRAQWTGQEWAEGSYAPNRAGYSKGRADYRFLAIREPPGELDPGDAAQLPFPTEEFEARGRCKLFALATNLTRPADRAILWHRERCGKSEEVRAVLKRDLAGGHMPSGPFGANAAGWACANLAHNLNALMKRPVLGPARVARRMKALRFHPIAPPGRPAPCSIQPGTTHSQPNNPTTAQRRSGIWDDWPRMESRDPPPPTPARCQSPELPRR